MFEYLSIVVYRININLTSTLSLLISALSHCCFDKAQSDSSASLNRATVTSAGLYQKQVLFSVYHPRCFLWLRPNHAPNIFTPKLVYHVSLVLICCFVCFVCYIVILIHVPLDPAFYIFGKKVKSRAIKGETLKHRLLVFWHK